MNKLNDFLNNKIDIRCSDFTKAYIISTFTNAEKFHFLSCESLILKHFEAQKENNFELLQNIGDFILWSGTFTKEFYEKNIDVNEEIGRNSYLQCYYLMNRKWDLYRELSNNLPIFISELRNNLIKFKENENINLIL